jgi:hypothetical protein
VAEKLGQQPELLGTIFTNLDRMRTLGEHARPYVEAWQRILDLPLEELSKKLAEDSEEMAQLRQSSPCAGVLSPRERWKIYEAFSARTSDQGSRNDRGN